MTHEYRYPPKVAVAGYARSAFGLTITCGPLLCLRPGSWMIPVLTAGAALFLTYSVSVVARHTLCLLLGQQGIATRGLFAARIGWDEIRRVELNYYSTRSDRSNGWIELIVRGPRRTIRVQSTIEGFQEIASRVAREAARRGYRLDERSRTHLASIGIEVAGLPDAQSSPGHGIGHA